MNASCAIAALTAVSLASHATAGNEHVSVDLGWFMNIGGGDIYYDGGFAPWISSGFGPGSTTHTVMGIDVDGILSTLGYAALAGITITDTGVNAYGTLSPGADIDLLHLSGVDSDAVMTYTYDGPNVNHRDEPSWALQRRTADLDSFSGAQEWDWTHVSLGKHGILTTTFLQPQRLGIYDPYLLLSEAGMTESFRVSLDAIVPAPGVLSVLAAAVLLPRRRRSVSRR
jgi:hypothetical protein